jgi:Hypoxia induced protein conserved region
MRPFTLYLIAMSGFFLFALVVFMILALGSLFIGLASMVKGGEFNRKYGNKLMQARVYMQGGALLMLLILFLTQGHP